MGQALFPGLEFGFEVRLFQPQIFESGAETVDLPFLVRCRRCLLRETAFGRIEVGFQRGFLLLNEDAEGGCPGQCDSEKDDDDGLVHFVPPMNRLMPQDVDLGTLHHIRLDVKGRLGYPEGRFRGKEALTNPE